jgi:hypothetical protein
MKRRHTLLLEELENWSDEEEDAEEADAEEVGAEEAAEPTQTGSQTESTPVQSVLVPPIPVHKSVSFTKNLTTDRLIYKSRHKILDMFFYSDSESDDDIPSPIEPVPVVSPPVARALVAPVHVSVPVAPVPIFHVPVALPCPLDFDNDPDSDDPAFCLDEELVHIDPSDRSY